MKICSSLIVTREGEEDTNEPPEMAKFKLESKNAGGCKENIFLNEGQ